MIEPTLVQTLEKLQIWYDDLLFFVEERPAYLLKCQRLFVNRCNAMHPLFQHGDIIWIREVKISNRKILTRSCLIRDKNGVIVIRHISKVPREKKLLLKSKNLDVSKYDGQRLYADYMIAFEDVHSIYLIEALMRRGRVIIHFLQG